VDNAIQALNWLRGFPWDYSADGADAPMQTAVANRLYGLAAYEQHDGIDNDCTAHEAFNELVRGRSLYEGGSTAETLAPYAPGFTAMPENIDGSPEVESLLDEGSQQYLHEEGERMRRPPEDVASDPLLKSLKVYSDPGLVRHRSRYREFVRDLKRRGMIEFTRDPAEICGVFFVYKKGRIMRRLIIDARRTNLHFRSPPHVSLITSEGLASFEVDLGDASALSSDELLRLAHGVSLTTGVCDIKDAFYRLRAPAWLRRYFCLPCLLAKDAGITGSLVDGARVFANEMIFPMLVPMAMGFAWSLFFCQAAGERLSSSAPGLSRSSLLSDRGRPLVISAVAGGDMLRHYIYVDNVGISARMASQWPVVWRT